MLCRGFGESRGWVWGARRPRVCLRGRVGAGSNPVGAWEPGGVVRLWGSSSQPWETRGPQGTPCPLTCVLLGRNCYIVQGEPEEVLGSTCYPLSHTFALSPTLGRRVPLHQMGRMNPPTPNHGAAVRVKCHPKCAGGL